MWTEFRPVRALSRSYLIQFFKTWPEEKCLPVVFFELLKIHRKYVNKLLAPFFKKINLNVNKSSAVATVIAVEYCVCAFAVYSMERGRWVCRESYLSTQWHNLLHLMEPHRQCICYDIQRQNHSSHRPSLWRHHCRMCHAVISPNWPLL